MIEVTSGWLATKQGMPRYFKVYVSDKKLYFEVVNERPYAFPGPGHLLQYVEKIPYNLPTEALETIERLSKEGFRVIQEMYISITAEMSLLSQNHDLETEWIPDTNRMIREIIEKNVTDDLQDAVCELFSDAKFYLTDDGKLIFKKGTDENI